MTRTSFLLLGFGALASGASRRKNFSGKWKASLEKSDFGPFPKPRSFIRVIEQDALRLSITTETVEPDGDTTSREMRFSLDGEESVNDLGDRRAVGYVRRLGSHLLLHTSSEMEGMKYELDELWTLTEDGKTLRVEGAVVTSMGEEHVFVVFDKQDR